ncbi:MAG: DUF808 domain-containing protein [Verrucomicrobiales bacterium]|nr:DUF808 domain-containing protein [Verrucomicrobiota bacterium JB025]
MASGSLLLLLDDIASVLDDVAVMTKRATAKTAGVLGDDLALNAQQVSGVVAKRELPVVWSVAKGSLVNKLILIPAALLISAFAGWLISPLLMIGGLYLCYEGCEKLAHKFLHKHDGEGHEGHDGDGQGGKKTVEEAKENLASLVEGGGEWEKAKIKGAVRTDFVLSAEIIAITLGTVEKQPLLTQALVLSMIGLIMTVGVYGLVGCIVKLDDLGLHLSQKESGAAKAMGRGILGFAPYLMKGLTIVGTAAMFLVGGGIIVHGIGPVHHWLEHLVEPMGGFSGGLASTLFNGVAGLVAGSLALVVMTGVMKLRGGK